MNLSVESKWKSRAIKKIIKIVIFMQIACAFFMIVSVIFNISEWKDFLNGNQDTNWSETVGAQAAVLWFYFTFNVIVMLHVLWRLAHTTDPVLARVR